MMGKIVQNLQNWLNDPFGTGKIVEVHDPLLSEIKEVKRESEKRARLLKQHRSFPIADSVGNKRLRRSV